jgi:molybdopterin molybdotransferase
MSPAQTAFSDIKAIIDSSMRQVAAEAIPLLAAYGRVSARSLTSTRDMPPFDVSALDGYSVKGRGGLFRVKAELSPLAPIPDPLKEGEAFFLPTGGRFPNGSRFIMREHVIEEGGWVRVEDRPDERRVVQKGDWLSKGAHVVDKGDIFTPEVMARTALAGVQSVQVCARPVVAVVTTGSELKKGRMANSNAFLLAGLIQRDGGEVHGLYTADDVEEEIRDLVKGLRGVDLFILTGGTSRGKKDVTRQALIGTGGRILLDAPPVIPGRTMTFGRKAATPFFILPGNPRAIRTLYEVFVSSGLRVMAGRAREERSQTLPLPFEVRKSRGMIRLVPVLLESRQAAIKTMDTPEPNGFVVCEQGEELLPPGTMVRVIET